MNAISSILSRATRQPDEGYKILSAPCHERHDSLMAGTPHHFYLYRAPNLKDWETTYAPIPSNYTLLHHNDRGQLPAYLDVDVVLTQNKGAHFNIFKQAADHLHCPHIVFEHCLPVGQMDSPTYLKMYKQIRGDFNVFITNYSREKWGWGPDEALVIPHGIDTELFCNRNEDRMPHILSVVNDWKNRGPILGYDIWERVTKGLPVKPVGNTPGFSQAAESVNQLVDFYNSSQVFINTSQVSPIPMSVLEALSVGCAVVSSDNCAIGEYIEHGVTGFLTNDEKQMRRYLMQLLNEPDLARDMGQKASQSIKEKCSLAKYHKTWQDLLELTDNFVYRG